MAEPILERITKALVDTLKGVTVSSGYHQDLKVQRFNRQSGYVADGDTAILKQTFASRASPEAESQTRMWWEQSYDLDLYIRESDDSSVAIDRRINFIAADCIQALLADYQRGGLAQDTRIDETEQWDALDGGVYGVTLRFTVLYEHDYEDPYAQ